jgi:tellurite resistance protein TerA
VALDWRQPQTGVEVDASAYVLGPGGRVRQDEDMIFYGQESFAGGALRLVEKTASSARFCLDVAALPEGVEKIVFCGSIDPADGTVDFTALAPARIEVTPEDAGQSRLVFEPEVSTAHLAALIFGEVYRRAGAWRFRAVGQGFAGGLGALARSYGVDIAD